MRRPLVVAAALVVGLGLGAVGALALDDEPVTSSPTTEAPPPPGPPPSTAGPTTAPPAPTTTAPPRRHPPGVLLVWTAGGLDPGLASAVARLPEVGDLTVVRGDLEGLVATETAGGRPARVAPGWTIPLDVLAVDPDRFADFAAGRARRVLRALGPGEAVLGETSAALRGLRRGGRLQLSGGTWLRVAGVVPDDDVAGAEAVVDLGTGASVGVTRDRYLLLHHRGPRAPLDTAIRAVTGEAVRTRAAGETPFLRHADAVLPQALVKARFGEFAVRSSGPGPVAIEPAWVDANIVTVDLPLLGRATCHRDLVPALRGALEDLRSTNLGHLVASFEGCYNPRTIAGSTQLSRHAWGAAVDLNFSANPTGQGSTQDPRLVDVFERWGFGSGDFWLVPDSGHFEWIGDPR